MNISLFYAMIAFSAVIGGLVLLVTILKPLIFPLLWAILIRIAAHPVYYHINRLIKREIISALVTTTLLTFIILLPFIILTENLTVEAVQNYNTFKGWFEKGVFPPLEQLKTNPLGNALLTKTRTILSYFGTDIKTVLLHLSKSSANLVLEFSGEIIKNVFTFTIKFVFMIIFLFFFFKDGEKWVHSIVEITPLKKKQIEILRNKFNQMIYAVIYGILLTGIAQGILSGIGYIAAGISSPILLGAATAIFSLVPFIGTTIIWIPVVGYLFLTGEITHAVVLGLWCLLVVGTIDNMIRPIFISGKSRTPLFLTIIGVFGGLSTFGFIGIILGPLILVISVTLFEFYLEYGRTQNSPPAHESR